MGVYETPYAFRAPIGANDLGIFQLVNRYFLSGFQREFTIKYLIDCLFGEVKELREEIMRPNSNEDCENFKAAFEAADVFIYLTHIASTLDLEILDLIGTD